jgi:hypothetical protein
MSLTSLLTKKRLFLIHCALIECILQAQLYEGLARALTR